MMGSCNLIFESFAATNSAYALLLEPEAAEVDYIELRSKVPPGNKEVVVIKQELGAIFETSNPKAPLTAMAELGG
jgi:hypothetical protein